MSDDVILYQRIASGYIPGLSEVGMPAPGTFYGIAPTSATFQNCRAVRPLLTPVGVYDIILPAGTIAPVGLGGVLFTSPPLVAPPVSTVVNTQGRVSVNVRALLGAAAAPPTPAGAPNVNVAIWYGSTLGLAALPIYPGIDNTRIVRIYVTSNFGVGAGEFADVDFDFSIERVIDPANEP
jgi:hypothetical protein